MQDLLGIVDPASPMLDLNATAMHRLWRRLGDDNDVDGVRVRKTRKRSTSLNSLDTVIAAEQMYK